VPQINEQRTRKELIDPQLQKADWHLREHSKIKIEIPVGDCAVAASMDNRRLHWPSSWTAHWLVVRPRWRTLASPPDVVPWRQEEPSVYKISPSDLTFAWDGCKYCFYLKVKHGIVLRGVFPGIFGRMANLTSGFYLGRSTQDSSADLPPGIVKLREGYVKSAPISIPSAASQCYINGRFDAVVEFEDGSYGTVDYKTSEAKAEQAAFYSRQLSAYAYALEHPAANALGLSPVSRIGLFCEGICQKDSDHILWRAESGAN
jgi:hypothetical protein